MSHKKMLQIVTKGDNKLKFFEKTSYFLTLCAILCGCTTSNQVVDNSEQKIDSHPIQIEQQKGRIDTETAIARTLKYNFEPIKKQLSSKIKDSVAQTNTFFTLQKIREGQNLSIATSLKELDFAILSTVVNTTENPQTSEQLISQVTIHNLTLGTIKAHKAAMYGHKKSFEWNRLIRQYQSQIATLLKKAQNDFSEDEFTYKKELENTIDRLKLYLQNTEQNTTDFYQLTRLDSPYPDLDGKTFYEKNVLPLQSKADTYQKSAFTNRLELKNIPSYSLDTIALDLANQYPESNSHISGYYLQDSTQDEILSRLGDEAAVRLLQTANTYQKNGKDKSSLKSQLSKDLHKAIYLQLELAYRLATRTAADYDIQINNLKQLKQNIQKLEKLGRPNLSQKIELLQAKQELWENENLADQILAERTVAVCALQFYSGLIEPTPEILDKNIADIASFVNTALHKKVSFATPRSINKISSEADEYTLVTQKENWAHKENWLEDLMAEKQSPQSEKIMSKPLTIPKTKTTPNKTVQLGSFLDKETAQKEWYQLTKDFPELSKYTPLYDTTSVAGITLHRLSIKYPQETSKELCTQLHKKGKECTLQD